MSRRTEPVTAYVGMGSNVGDRLGYIQLAKRALDRAPGVELVGLSSVYETEPWGYTHQGAFLNAVVAVRTSLGPCQILILLKIIEHQLGREKTVHWGPRQIDLDLLLYNKVRLVRRDLIVPHPGIHDRAFVLVPLRDLVPDYVSPDGRSIDELLTDLGTSGVRRI